MTWKLLTFEPIDVLIGSDHRPLDDSNFSQDHELSPMAFAGGLRTEILSSSGYDFSSAPSNQPNDVLRQLGGDLGVAFRDKRKPNVRLPEPTVCGSRFSVRGPILYRTGSAASITTHWPAPRFIVQDDDEQIHALQPARNSTALTDQALSGYCILDDPSDSSKPIGGHCNLGLLRKWLTGSLWNRNAERLYSIELRSGHQRNKQGVAEDHALFSREARRFSDQVQRQRRYVRAPSGYAIWAKIDATLLPPDGARIRLGGDGHGAILGHADETDALTRIDDLKQATLAGIKNGKGLLLYLASPSIFSDGWCPPYTPTEHGIELVGAAVDPPRTIAGWDVGRGRPKPPLRAVPAGATYFYDVTDKDKAEKLIEQVHFNESVSTLHPHLGFGLALCGIWEG